MAREMEHGYVLTACSESSFHAWQTDVERQVWVEEIDRAKVIMSRTLRAAELFEVVLLALVQQ